MGLASLELAGRRGKRKPGSKQKESEESYFMDQNTPKDSVSFRFRGEKTER